MLNFLQWLETSEIESCVLESQTTTASPLLDPDDFNFEEAIERSFPSSDFKIQFNFLGSGDLFDFGEPEKYAATIEGFGRRINIVRIGRYKDSYQIEFGYLDPASINRSDKEGSENQNAVAKQLQRGSLRIMECLQQFLALARQYDISVFFKPEKGVGGTERRQQLYHKMLRRGGWVQDRWTSDAFFDPNRWYASDDSEFFSHDKQTLKRIPAR